MAARGLPPAGALAVDRPLLVLAAYAIAFGALAVRYFRWE